MDTDTAFVGAVSVGDIIVEEGVVMGRHIIKISGLTTALGAAEVNGPSGAKGQYMWNGTYVVQLDRGHTIDGVYHFVGVGLAAQSQRVLSRGERVAVTWLNRRNDQIPVILEGCTLDFYNKQLFGHGHLLDEGEQIFRSGIAAVPGTSGDYPFSDNQFESPGTRDTTKNISIPGGEVFLDKFGRVISLSRHSDHEFLVTYGKIDTGQDDVSGLKTISEQDTYYDAIENDESSPVNLEEPSAPKSLNLAQYQQDIRSFSVVGDPDPNRTVKRGVLPRFDKWKFQPVVVRKYRADSDGETESGTFYSVHQERAQTVVTPESTIFGYVRTITDQGDLKEFVPRHINCRVVGDILTSVGGNVELKIKPKDRNADGSSNTVNLLHEERLADGTYRMRVSEDVAHGKAAFDCKISPTGAFELYIKEGGATATDNNISVKYDADGTVNVKSKKKIVLDSDADIYVGGETGAEPIPLGTALKTYLDSFIQVFSTWIPAPSDGGAALKTLLTQWVTSHALDNYLSSSRKVN